MGLEYISTDITTSSLKRAKRVNQRMIDWTSGIIYNPIYLRRIKTPKVKLDNDSKKIRETWRVVLQNYYN